MSGLVVKQKLSYSLTGLNLIIPFSLIGFQAEPIQYIGVLLQASSLHTLRIRDISGNLLTEKVYEASPNYKVCILGENLNITCPNIYILEAESTNPLSIFELNLATRCVCSSS